MALRTTLLLAVLAGLSRNTPAARIASGSRQDGVLVRPGSEPSVDVVVGFVARFGSQPYLEALVTVCDAPDGITIDQAEGPGCRAV